MSFAETMTLEIRQSRRDRSRRALFCAKLMGICLVLLVGDILRTEPEFRAALMNNGINGMVQLMGREAPQSVEPQDATPQNARQSPNVLPRSTVKVNRSSGSANATSTPQTKEIADDLGRTLSTRKVGN